MPVTGLSPQFQFASWRVPQFARAIEYPLEVMDEIRAFACDELLQLSHGGDEVGGILFGTRRDDLIRILTWRPIACEHTQGEGLRLSYNDRMNLAVQLEMARQNSDLKDLRPLGWFVSHPQGNVALSATDLEIYGGFFPESWQVTLVICPQGSGRARAGFFVREAEDKVAAESSYRCFDLEGLHVAPDVTSPMAPLHVAPPLVAPPLVAPPFVALPPIAPPPVSAPPIEAPPVVARMVSSAAPMPEVEKQERAEAPPPPEAPQSAEAAPPAHIAPPTPTAQPAPPQPPRVWAPVRRPEPAKTPPPEPSVAPRPLYQPSFEMEETLPTRDRWLWAIPIVLALGIAAFMLYQRRAPNTIALRATNEAQTVQLMWDGNSSAIRDAVRGEIDINDGGNNSQVSLSSEQLHAGKLSYLPQSGDVSFVLTVHPANGEPLHDSTRLLAPAFHASTEAPQLLPPNPTSTQPVAPRDARDAQAQQLQIQRLNAELSQERARSTELQNLVRILENRLGIQPEARQPH